ncbi:nitrogen regulation protein NR(II) [Snodgrassella sp. CFCC 13594]|uniref:two-component system sensor histidine kinase NtrB n=1 Tax=Snodgrassella sp. CFCC 13594 TaxID=1775559 RepID=UPI0008341D47|nr:HAMP domain-containing sensor histidine kinase [Snodgrassella sp. CFCC 13594]
MYDTVPWHHQQSLEKLPGLINIGRISLLFSLLTFHLLVQSLLHNFSFNGLNILTFSNVQLYAWAGVYGCLIILSIVLPQWQQATTALPSAHAVADITMMVWLMYIAGGVTSGFGILVLPFITTSCLLSFGRYPLLYAGYAAMLIVLSTLWLNREVGLDRIDMRSWATVVILVAAVFLVAALTAYAATYLARSRSALRRQSQVLDSFKRLTDVAFNHVQEAVVVLDRAGIIWLLNRKAQDYFPSLRADEGTALFEPIMAVWQRHQIRAFDTETTLQAQLMRVRARPINEGNTPLLMLFVRANSELAAEAMAMKLAALGQLTANLAHEIRNPMSAIRQANELLQEEDDSPPHKRLHGMIENNIGRIDKMLEDVSSLNKSDKIHKQVVDLMQFWREFRQEFVLTQPKALHAIDLQVGEGKLQVWCDPMHLQQILWNLMNNAWRHSQQNAGAIRVVFRPLGRAEIAIVVMDNGAGVSAENQDRLFEPFFTTSAGGTGLGLYVARELAQANLGRLRYESKINGFEIVLPRVANE